MRRKGERVQQGKRGKQTEIDRLVKMINGREKEEDKIETRNTLGHGISTRKQANGEKGPEQGERGGRQIGRV